MRNFKLTNPVIFCAIGITTYLLLATLIISQNRGSTFFETLINLTTFLPKALILIGLLGLVISKTTIKTFKIYWIIYFIFSLVLFLKFNPSIF